MEDKPRLKIKLTKLDKSLEAICLILLLALWLFTTAFFSKLPDQIPSHYNAAGQADGFSGKAYIVILPIIATIIYVGMTVLNKHPHVYSYHTRVTAENAKRLYTSATTLIRVLKLVVVVVFSAIVFTTYKIVWTGGNGLGVWFLPAAVALFILPNIFYLFHSLKANKPCLDMHERTTIAKKKLTNINLPPSARR